jgi:two-component system, OmpR family, sensor kinase
LSAIPIRIRLTLPFALAMAVVLAGLGAFVYVRVGSTLLRSTDQNLLAQAKEATTRLEAGRPLLDRDATSTTGFSEVLDGEGNVVESSPAGLRGVLDRESQQLVLAGRSLRRSGSLPGRSEHWRLLAVPATAGGLPRMLVLGSSLSARDESLEHLRHELLWASPLALLLATLAGYLLAGAALRPVEAMRRQAGAITAATPGRRLPVPRATDEVSRLAVTLNDMLERLETAFQHERRFVADASHELRTPLSLLRTELELALRKPRSHAELEAALRSASEETERLTRLAEDLMLIARSDQGALPVHRETVSAQTLVSTVATRFHARAAELGRAVTVDPGSDVPFEADPKWLEQALGNLVDNALMHGSGTVTLAARALGETVELHVTDEGRGFPVDFADRAFDRFSRAGEARRRGGSGLGLAIVQSIAAAHGGSASTSRHEGGGADVWLSLPAARGSAPARLRSSLGAVRIRSRVSPPRGRRSAET